MSSRLSQARPAVRPALKGRMMLSGPAGAGKSRSGLMICTMLAEGGPILGIDTEKESLLTYADDFDFQHLPWRPPYDASELADLILEAGKEYAAIQIDSLSHFWRKEGGVLDVAGGKFTGWKEARPIQEKLVEAILNCDAHVVLCVRSKVEHAQEKDEHGKQTVRKLGMAAQQDDDLEFEMNVAVELSMDHTATISKSRTTVLPIGRTFRGGAVSEMARIYGEWLAAGESPAPKNVVADLQARMNGIESKEKRKAVKDEFLSKFGRPEQLKESAVVAATALVASFEAEDPEEPPEPPSAPSPSQPSPEPVPSSPVAAQTAPDADPDGAPFADALESALDAAKGKPTPPTFPGDPANFWQPAEGPKLPVGVTVDMFTAPEGSLSESDRAKWDKAWERFAPTMVEYVEWANKKAGRVPSPPTRPMFTDEDCNLPPRSERKANPVDKAKADLAAARARGNER